MFSKDLKMVLDVSLLNTQHYKVQIKGKRATPRKVGVVAIERIKKLSTNLY